jgi:hypothetical protein
VLWCARHAHHPGIDRAETIRIRAARGPLIAGLTRAAEGAPWRYLLVGSFAGGTARRGSRAEIVVVDAGERWRDAEQAALDACDTLGLDATIIWWDFMRDDARANLLRESIRCG